MAVPGDIDEVIKEAYGIMMMANWDSARKQAYEKAREREIDERNELAREKEESKLEGEVIGEVRGEVKEKMNNQPRKCLGFKTPNEVFYNRKLQYVALDP